MGKFFQCRNNVGESGDKSSWCKWLTITVLNSRNLSEFYNNTAC